LRLNLDDKTSDQFIAQINAGMFEQFNIDDQEQIVLKDLKGEHDGKNGNIGNYPRKKK
jgi:hypothetical protein